MRIFTTATLLATTLCSLVSSQNVTYKVISVTDKQMAVEVKGQLHYLQPTEGIPILYSGQAPIGNYSYAIVDKKENGSGVIEKEDFTRTFSQGKQDTPYEFFNRNWNTKQVHPFPQLLDKLPTMNRIDTQLHKEDSITTFYLQANQTEIDLMHQNPLVDNIKVLVNLTLIENNQTQIFTDVELKLAGRSSRYMDKLSYSLSIPKKQSLYGYRKLKLRSLRADPAYIREKLCYDIMKSLGLPVTGTSYTRLIMNNQPIGLYLMIEAYKNPWYKNEFANGEKLDQGVTYQSGGTTISDLSYLGDDNETKYDGPYKIAEDPKKGDTTFDKIMAFIKFVSESPVGEGAETDWNQHIDMDSVIRSMVMEIVAGLSDGYMTSGNNYYLYDNLQEKRFTYLAADFDTSMGTTTVNRDDQWSGDYTQYPGFNLRPLTKRFIQVPAFKLQFEQLLKKVNNELMNPNIILKRMDDLVSFLHQDVEWDDALPKVNDYRMGQFIDHQYGDSPPPPAVVECVKYPSKLYSIPFREAVYGGSAIYNENNKCVTSVKEWVTTIHNNINLYFTQHPSST
ncbi:unnamed protein product [Cunninghamella blakesleeana]